MPLPSRFIAPLLLALLLPAWGRAADLSIRAVPDSALPGGQITLVIQGPASFSSLVSVSVDGTRMLPVRDLHPTQLIILLPDDLPPGAHTILVRDQLLEERGSVVVTVLPRRIIRDPVDGNDPDPHSQTGTPTDFHAGPGRGGLITTVTNTGGGSLCPSPATCDSLHRIDGRITDSVWHGVREWSGITPLRGRFSNLYMDYCDARKTLYLLNDWFWGTGEYDSLTCYNRFELWTGNGSEHWQIWVYHSIRRGIRVIRNGVVVADSMRRDSTYVLGGMAGFGPSILDDTAHTMYEFGLRVSSGIWYMPEATDPYRPPSNLPGVTTVCGENGYGLVQEPSLYGGSMDAGGITIRQAERIVPLAGTHDLVAEPRTVVRNTTSCTNPLHIVDGEFSRSGDQHEWAEVTPAVGMYSRLYADLCDSVLHIMNDWVLGSAEPDSRRCYNLFSIYTRSLADRWAVAVYQDIRSGIRVWKNGIEVTHDSSIVLGGRYGFGSSPEDGDTPNTLYEFGIRTEPGCWMMMLHDPGPASFCDGDPTPAPRRLDAGPDFGGSSSGPDSLLHSAVTAWYNDEARLSVRATGDMREWFGRSFRATISYEYHSFFPTACSAGPSPDGTARLDAFSWKVLQPGTIVVEGRVDGDLTGTGELFSVSGIVLAGPAHSSVLRGTLEVANRTTVMRIAEIPPVTLTASSRCPLTNEPILSTQAFIITSVAPQPLGAGDGILRVGLLLTTPAVLTATVFSQTGAVERTLPPVALEAGERLLPLDLSALRSGTHLLRITDGVTTVHAGIHVIR